MVLPASASLSSGQLFLRSRIQFPDADFASLSLPSRSECQAGTAGNFLFPHGPITQNLSIAAVRMRHGLLEGGARESVPAELTSALRYRSDHAAVS